MKALQQYLDHGFNIEKTNDWGYTLAINAVKHDAKDALRLLIQRGAKINRFKRNINSDFCYKYIPLTTALITNQTDMVRLLVELGADVDTEFSYDLELGNGRLYTPLSYAISEQKDAQINLLLALGAEPSIQDIEGDPLLYRAINDGNTDMALILIKVRIDPNSKHRGKTVLMLALQKSLPL